MQFCDTKRGQIYCRLSFGGRERNSLAAQEVLDSLPKIIDMQHIDKERLYVGIKKGWSVPVVRVADHILFHHAATCARELGIELRPKSYSLPIIRAQYAARLETERDPLTARTGRYF